MKPRIKKWDGLWYCWVPRAYKTGIVGIGYSAWSAFHDWQNGGINNPHSGLYVL